MKNVLKAVMFTILIGLIGFTSGCYTAAEQGTVQVETKYGKIVQVHRAGDWFTTFGAGSTSFEVDMRNHMDGVDYVGVTKDNANFYMKVDVVYHPIDNDQEIGAYTTAFGFDPNERNGRRWGVLNQLVKNACRDATAGRYDAYDLKAAQSKIIEDVKNSLAAGFKTEMHLDISSIGMEIPPQFSDGRIDDAANQVVAAQKLKQAAEAQKAAAETLFEKAQIDNKIYTQSPQAFELEKLKIQKDIAQAWSEHQGTLIFGNSGSMQYQIPGGK